MGLLDNTNNALTEVLKPIAGARGLPNAHYTDSTTFEIEKHAVLFENWAGLGFGKDIPNPGDAKPTTFLGVPLLMVRDKDGEIGVFQNTCRHRGMILVDEPKNLRGVIRCPYHSWCYSLKGELRTTPHVGGLGQNTHDEIDRTTLGLVAVASHVWQDIVFVNVSGTAAPFETVHQDLLTRWAEFDQPIYHGGTGASFKLEVETNWKLAVENYCESYHLPWVHPGLNTYSRLEDHYNIERPGAYSGQGTLVYKQLRGDDDRVFPDFEGLSEKWNEGAEYVALYPNVLLGVHRDHFFAIVLEPVSLTKTVEHVELYYTRNISADPDYAEMLTRNAEQWKQVFEEDIFVVEGMQRGRAGPFFDGGRFSPAMDGPTHMFHQWVASCVSEKREAAE